MACDATPHPGRCPPMSDQLPAFGTADLTSCDREPIHIPASIQPHGALLVLDPMGMTVLQAGGATARMLGVEPAALLGTRLEALLTAEQLARLRTMLDGKAAAAQPLHACTLVAADDGQPIDVLAHVHDGVIILELERLRESNPEDPMALVQTMLARVNETRSAQEFCQGIAEEVRRVCGFQRVMVYRFLPDGSGVVDAEACDAGIEPFLGLYYPASDIPRQARELYLRNWIRMIPDACYEPAPIVPPARPQDGRSLDLSHSALRSVSPIHLEYLANMGVKASMSLSLILYGRLWGLIACHHDRPRFLPHRLRMACELFAQMVSARLETKVATQEFEAQLHARRIHGELLARMSQEVDLAHGLVRYRPNLLDYIAADGVGLWLGGDYTTLGAAPRTDQVRGLVDWLNATAGDGVFHTDHLPLLYPPARDFADVACGLVALSVSREPRDYVLWFRPEVIHTVTWAGNPNKPVIVGPLGDRLTPRASFAAWSAEVKLHSRPWRSSDIEAAQMLRVSLLEVILRRIDQVAREREQARQRQAELAAELDRRLAETQAVAIQLRQEAEHRALLEAELSKVLRRTVAEQEAERQHIARELHDSLAQSLTLLQLGLDQAGRMGLDEAGLRSRLAALKELTSEVGREVNRLAWEIRPASLDELGLPAAVRHLAEIWRKRATLEFDLRITLRDQRLDPGVESVLYRVLQEAITNVARHAEASHVAVILDVRDREVQLVIEDDGRGFVPDGASATARPTGSLGLLGIRERLSQIGGTLEIESAPGRGTTLFIRVPL